MSETQTTELMQDSALFDDVAKQALGRYEFDGDEAKLLTFSEKHLSCAQSHHRVEGRRAAHQSPGLPHARGA